MATIQKRKTKKGASYRVMIRQSDGFPPSYKTFPALQEAKDWAKQEEVARRQGSYFPDRQRNKHTLADLIDRYVSIILPSIPKSGEDIRRHLDWWNEKIGKYSLQKISPDLIAQCRQELAGGMTYKGKQRSPATVNRYMSSLSSVFSYGIKECGWILENPCFRVTKLKESRGRDRVLSQEECDVLLRACDKSRNKHLLPIVLIAISTGMRQGEILGLTWPCLDFERQTITLKETKNGRPRTVSLIGQAHEILRERYLTRSLHTPYVFPSRKRFGNICIRKAWNEALKRAGITDLRFHDLRHSFCTYAAEAGASNLELAAAMGHQTLQMLQRYTHMNATITHRLSIEVHNRLLGKRDEEKQSQNVG